MNAILCVRWTPAGTSWISFLQAVPSLLVELFCIMSRVFRSLSGNARDSANSPTTALRKFKMPSSPQIQSLLPMLSSFRRFYKKALYNP